MSLRRLAALVVLLALAGVIAGLVLSAQSPSKPNGGGANTSTNTAVVQRRDLVQADTESGTLSYAGAQTVYDRLSGTVTWLPSVGALIKPGGTLFKVDGRPVILLDGTMPAYRDLGPSDSDGQDILQLNRNLIRLGFNPEGIVPDGVWQAATTAGVDALQASLGETETGTLVLGQVVFLPGQQLVSSVQGTLGNASAADRTPGAAAEFVSLHTRKPAPTEPAPTKPAQTTPRRRHPPRTQLQTLQALVALLKAEIAEFKAGKGPAGPTGNPPSAGAPGRSGTRSPTAAAGNPSAGTPTSAGSPAGGAGGASPSAILQTTSAQLVVTVDLDASKQGEAKVGESVTVQLPGGDTVNGRVTAVSPVAQTAADTSGNGGGPGNSNGNGGGNGNGGSSGSTIPVTIALRGRHTGAGLDQATVSVNFAAAVASNVLSVPVTALVATGGGNYAVQTAAAPHRLIPVSTGVFATGFVEISGHGIYPGLRVTDSQG